ncbi:MAG: hypothetical protein IJW01_00695 [Paludibacteraceae bacterium]|nr:hypothetical protein [Paludibacteraceae bacterium]
MRYKSLILIVFICLTSCKTLKPLQEVDKSNHADTVKLFERDSIYFSVQDTLRMYIKGDTVYNEVIRWRIDYKEKLRLDTVISYDSIYLDKVITVQEMSRFQSVFFWIGIVLTILLIAWIIWKIVRRFK